MTKQLSTIGEIIPPQVPKQYFHVYQIYTIRIQGGRELRNKLIKYLSENGIASKVYYDPAIHLTKLVLKPHSFVG